MNIVIIGAGETGGYVAGLLSNDQHNVIVVDHDKKKLERLAQSADIATHGALGVIGNYSRIFLRYPLICWLL